ncbi:diadenylate cyclase [Xanthomonas hortorum]|uniref:diadenylate cyclase n=1 Tax=Xanthomonas hortorum TaxID=56454 RepID=UPI0031BA831F
MSDRVEHNYRNHRLQNMFYGDEESMRDKPEWMLCDSVTSAVRTALEPYDKAHEVISFVGISRRVNDFYVAPVIQVPAALFCKFPPLSESIQKDDFEPGHGPRSLIHAAISIVLEEASSALQEQDPGRDLRGKMRNADEIARLSAKAFMHSPGRATSVRYVASDLFERLNLISSLLYEGDRGVGRILLADPDHSGIEHLLRFQNPVRLSDSRWTRKVLQLAGPAAALVADAEFVYGLGRLQTAHDPDDETIFAVDFLDHYTWALRCGDRILLRSLYGVPALPSELVDKQAFLVNLATIFPSSTSDSRDYFWTLFNAAAHQGLGSMIVVAEDAESEAARLEVQGTRIEPTKMSADLLRQASAIDGSILMDPLGYCHAIGVILDGMANDRCLPSRGSRFNSAVRYVRSQSTRRLAIVVSEDKTVDIVPPIRPLQSRTEIEGHVRAFASASVHDYHLSMNWLYDRRLFLSAQQCSDINDSLARLDAMPRDVGEIRFLRDAFDVDPEFDEAYLLD